MTQAGCCVANSSTSTGSGPEALTAAATRIGKHKTGLKIVDDENETCH
jgi:hypothetical protein